MHLPAFSLPSLRVLALHVCHQTGLMWDLQTKFRSSELFDKHATMYSFLRLYSCYLWADSIYSKWCLLALQSNWMTFYPLSHHNYEILSRLDSEIAHDQCNSLSSLYVTILLIRYKSHQVIELRELENYTSNRLICS